MAPQPKVFISHTTRDPRDRELAQIFAKGLIERGAEVWIAPGSIPVGAEWHPEIVTGILEKCTDFVVIVSASSVDHAVDPNWVLREIELARERRAHDQGFTVIIPRSHAPRGSATLAALRARPIRSRPGYSAHVRAAELRDVRSHAERNEGQKALKSCLVKV